MGDYLFVTRPRSEDEKVSGLDLFISMHGERFVQAKFDGVDENNLTNIDYHIVDVTDDGEVRGGQKCFYLNELAYCGKVKV